MEHVPEELYAHVEEEGRRRLSRPLVELAATALVAGFDVVFGIAALSIAHELTAARFGESMGQLVGALAFGIGFVFAVAGRSELFTENFLVPLAGLDRRDRGSWLKLAELWAREPRPQHPRRVPDDPRPELARGAAARCRRCAGRP